MQTTARGTHRTRTMAWVMLSMVGASSTALASGALGASRCDFNGDGRDDQAFGVPGEGVGGSFEAGAVNVLYGTGSGLGAAGDQLWHQDNIGGLAEPGEHFGSALACGDFDDDGFDDLAIGVPGQWVGGDGQAGEVDVLYGSATGLGTVGNQVWTQDSPNIGGTADPRDRFGSALASGDFDGDGFDDLAVGVPSEGVGSNELAGAINILYGTGSGLSAAGDQLWTQDDVGSADPTQKRDLFGFALASGDFDDDGRDDLAIGVPMENIGSLLDGGAVNVLYGTVSGLSAAGSQLWTQDSAGVEGAVQAYDRLGSALATGDFDGDGFDDLAIGAPGEDVISNTVFDGGAVNVLYGAGSGLSAAGDQMWTQHNSGVSDGAEVYDRFGSALASGDFDGDGVDDLAVGSPWDSIGGDPEAGAVSVLYGESVFGLSAVHVDFWHQDRPGIAGVTEPFDRLGSTLASGDYDGDGRDDLSLGTPDENIGSTSNAGSANVLYGGGSGLTSAGDQLWHQNSSGIAETSQTADHFSGLVRSDGVYRIPYADGTNIKVTADHHTHSPQDRIDMHGVGGAPYTIVAAASGTIVALVDSNAEPTDDNNYVWIAHANGEWTKYSHFATGSVTALGHAVGNAVSVGTPLGTEGDVGQASGPHLHFEVAVPRDPADPLTAGGFIKGVNRDPTICNLPGRTFLAGNTITADECGAVR